MKINIFGVVLAGGMLLAGTAFAGPQMTFGPNNEGSLQLDYKGQFQVVTRDTGSGPSKDDSSADLNFRRNRLALMGSYGEIMSMYVQTEFLEKQNITPLTVVDGDAATDFTILDAQIRFEFNKAFNVHVGKFKYNMTRENLEACEAPLTLDRSLFIRAPFVATRDKGVAVWGNLFNDIFQYRLDVMNGRTATGTVTPESNLRYTGRAHVSLLDPETGYGYKGTYLGKKKVLTIGGAYQTESKVAYSDTTAKSGAVDYKGWTADLFFEYPIADIGTVTFSGAYENVDLGGAYKGLNPDSGTVGLNGEKNGWYLKGAYMLPTIPLQLFGRYEKWQFASLNLNNAGLTADNINDQLVHWYGFGANYYFRDQNLKLTAEYSRTEFDKWNASTKDFSTFITQLQLIF
ncbi:MAG: selenite/tellurite reduction operon porin ExtI [Desulfuromonadales bacterium]